MSEGDDATLDVTDRTDTELEGEPEDPPVVARMVVEIRSDGLRTVARGAIEDIQTGQRAAILARGTTPIALAASLARSMFSAPVLATRAVGAKLLGRFASRRSSDDSESQ